MLGISSFRSDRFGPSTPEELAALEGELGIHLPHVYHWICLAYGKFLLVCIDSKGDDGSLYSFGSWIDARAALAHVKSPPDEFSPDCLAVSDDGLGNYHCLGIRGHRRGKVYFWIHDIGWGPVAEEYVSKGMPAPDGIATPCFHFISEDIHRIIMSFVSY
ncbi:SMI1/KNR4 family protein [Fimbriiglobus ruber]|uniref:SMI1/KNR4 family protein n=1 Tax=Fimbriiglobus ruber TaxID=1908690 RepID=UPI003B846E0C